MWPTALRPKAAFGFATAFDRAFVGLLASDAAAVGRCCLVCSDGVDGQDFSGSGSAFETSCFRASFVPAEGRLLRPSLAVWITCCASQAGVRVVREAALRSDPDVARGVRDRRSEPLLLSAILLAYGLGLSVEEERETERVPRVPCVGVLGVLGAPDLAPALLLVATGTS
jgi:hypothetical protein